MHMRAGLLAVAGVLSLGTAALAADPSGHAADAGAAKAMKGKPPGKGATAELKDARGTKIGTATLTEDKGAVTVKLEVSGLQPGPRAFHIHAIGKCEGPDFKSAGPHYNPHNKKHGSENPEGPHAGDMPNIVVGADGKGTAEVTVAKTTLGALLANMGTSLVVHEKEDDNKTDPAGNAGARIACGVVAK